MSNRILSYKGLIQDGEQETILLSTKKGEVGYRIHKFQCMQDGFGNSEMVIKIFKESQSSINNVIDFSDNRLLAACMISGSSSGEVNQSMPPTVIFDQEIFNQDIFITAAVSNSADPTNYYLELEVIKLDESQAMVATLKDIRNNS